MPYSWWVTLHGHGHPVMAAAIAEQAHRLEQVIFADFTHEPAEQLAERLSRITGLDRLFFSDNGSTAVEVAEDRLSVVAQPGTPRHQIVAFVGLITATLSGRWPWENATCSASPSTTNCSPCVPWPHTWWGDEAIEAEQAALDYLEQQLETPTAAVILEPLLQGAEAWPRSDALCPGVEKRVKQSQAC